jgi:2Fe-2S ferredoxin
MANTFKVKFNFIDPSSDPIEVEVLKGDTILDAALDNDISLHHNCGAVLACSTCHIYVTKGMETLPEISDAEEDFIDRAVNPKLNSRLACQCKIIADVEVTIPDQSVHLGH